MRVFVLRAQAQVDRLSLLLHRTWKEQFDAGVPLEVVVTAHKKRRSNAQNRLYWAVLAQVSEQAYVGKPPRRYQKEHWHEFFARRFIGYDELPDGSGQVAISTSELDASEFSGYIDKIKAWAGAELNVSFTEEHDNGVG